MKIKRDLPQFKEVDTLLIVAGDQSGILYHAYNGAIEKIEESKVPLPRYSDREGAFKRRVRQGLSKLSTLSSSGAPYEKKEQKAQQDFLRQFKKKIKSAVGTHEIGAIYLFVPDYFEKTLISELAPEHTKIIDKVFNGTYLKEHPFTLLKKVLSYKEEIADKVAEPISEDAKKLLKKAEQAEGKKPPATPKQPKETKQSGKLESQVKQFLGREKE